MKTKSIISFVLVIVIIAAMTVAIFGDIEIGSLRVPDVLDEEFGVNKGLDLVGGSVIVFEPNVDSNYNVTEDEMASAETIIRTRLDSINQTGATLTRQGETGIRVEIPNIDNPQDAVDYIGQTAALNFIDVDGNIVMEGNDTNIKGASMQYGPLSQYGNNEYYVELELTEQGRAIFKSATAQAVARKAEGANMIGILLDYTIVSSPMVDEVIDSNKCIISGNFDRESAVALADVINSGRLPFSLKAAELRSVGPTLGQEALDTSIFAAIIGIIIVMLFMLLIYRLPGLVADISLTAYISLVCLIMTGFYHSIGYVTTLSLSGIAGVILSIGMAVDANVVIFERIKDELNAGKSVGASVESGFKRALTAVIDSNVTTIISCVVLYFFGTGEIKGFAETLFIGVVVSLLTAVFLTKYLLKLVVKFGINNPWVYGASKRRDV